MWEFSPGRGALNVPSNSAILHRKSEDRVFGVLHTATFKIVVILQSAVCDVGTFLLFHRIDYRVCEFGGDDCIKTPSVEDRTAHKYSSRLIERVGAIYEHLRVPCKLSDLPPAPTRPPPVKKKTLRIGKMGETKNSTKTSSSVAKEKPK